MSITVGEELCAHTDFPGEVSHGVSHSVPSPIRTQRGLGSKVLLSEAQVLSTEPMWKY